MAIFCTKCGTSNAEDHSFCEHCGAPLRKPAATPMPEATSTPDAAVVPRGSRKAVYAAAAVGGFLLVGAGALYVAMATPAPTSTRLLAAAKAGHGEGLTQRARQELCLSNMNYAAEPFNVAQYDQGTQDWLNTLVSAGLYSPGVTVAGGGFFARSVVQYNATPELAKWREGRRLCLGKGVEIADVVDIGQPIEKKLIRGNEGAASVPTIQAVSAQLVLQAADVAPWLDKADVQGTVLAQISGWQYQGGKLQKKTAEVFGLREGQWATGPAYKAELEQQSAAARRSARAGEESASASDGGGIFARLGQLFSFGGHPLQGSWRVDTAGMGELFGRTRLPDDLSPAITFTRDTMEVGGQSIKCKFEVDGQRVKVTPEGQSESQIFEMRDSNTAVMDMGFMQVSYKRVP